MPVQQRSFVAGLFSIDVATHRRSCVNETVLSSDDDGFALAVSQSFGICPQYSEA